MARFRMQFKKDYNLKRVIAKIFVAVIVLYVGGTILNELGGVLNCTASPFYKGLTLIGWTVSDNVNPYTSGTCNATGDAVAGNNLAYSGLVTSVSGTGILTVVGIVAIASVVLEFVKFKL